MQLHQKTVLKHYLVQLDKALVLVAFERYKKDFLSKIENIKASKRI